MKKTDISLKSLLFSTPAIVKDTGSEEIIIAIVRGDVDKELDKYTSIDAYSEKGKQLRGFPLMKNESKGAAFNIAPAHQLVSEDVKRDGKDQLFAVDLEGRLNTIKSDGAVIDGKVANPERGMLVWPPVSVANVKNQWEGFILLSRNYGPLYASQDSVDLVDVTGRSMSGFPVKLQEPPKQSPPVVDIENKRIFVLLESGAIDAIDFGGKRLPGYPVRPQGEQGAVLAVGMTYFKTWKSLVLVSNNDRLFKLDTNTAKGFEIPVKNAQHIGVIATIGDQLVVVDDATGQLHWLDLGGQISRSFSLQWEPYNSAYYLKVEQSPDIASTKILIFSTLETDPDMAVEKLYQQHKTKESDQEIEQYRTKYIKRNYPSNVLDKAAQDDVKHFVMTNKRGYLKGKLGLSSFAEMKGNLMAARTRFEVLATEGGVVKSEYSDAIQDYSPDTEFYLSARIFPLITIDQKQKLLRTILPLNYYTSNNDNPADVYRSLMRLYTLPIP